MTLTHITAVEPEFLHSTVRVSLHYEEMHLRQLPHIIWELYKQVLPTIIAEIEFEYVTHY